MPQTFTADDGHTVADLIEKLGSISPRRIRLKPLPGKATEKDLIRANDHSGRLYELVEGTLVEKAVGYPESVLTMQLGKLLSIFLDDHPLGHLSGADGGMRLMPGLVRLPDLAFLAQEQTPDGVCPTDAIAGLPPTLAIEVLSKGNTRKEMRRKLREYFLAGTKLVWYVDLKTRSVQVFTSPENSATLTEADALEGGDVLPGFTVPVATIFAKVPKPAPKAGKPRRRKPL
jgi:Uma2 family endonuclease